MKITQLDNGHVRLEFDGEPANGIQCLEFFSYDDLLVYIQESGATLDALTPLANLASAVTADPALQLADLQVASATPVSVKLTGVAA